MANFKDAKSAKQSFSTAKKKLLEDATIPAASVIAFVKSRKTTAGSSRAAPNPSTNLNNDDTTMTDPNMPSSDPHTATNKHYEEYVNPPSANPRMRIPGSDLSPNPNQSRVSGNPFAPGPNPNIPSPTRPPPSTTPPDPNLNLPSPSSNAPLTNSLDHLYQLEEEKWLGQNYEALGQNYESLAPDTQAAIRAAARAITDARVLSLSPEPDVFWQYTHHYDQAD